jgi:predicted metallopeptidase
MDCEEAFEILGIQHMDQEGKIRNPVYIAAEIQSKFKLLPDEELKKAIAYAILSDRFKDGFDKITFHYAEQF